MKKPLLVLLLSLGTTLFAQNIAGTYSGSLKIETPDGKRDSSGTVIVKQDGDALTITAGPNADQQQPASNIERTGGALKFEVVPPDGNGVIRFNVTIKESKLTGKMTRGDQSRSGELDLVKQ
jgi:hypothetical protein